MEEHEQALVDWLSARGSDEWHQVAIDWNWDAGVDVLAWIAAQPDCDRATAQALIVLGGADYYLRFPDRATLVAEQPVNLEVFDLLVPIIARWNAGGYTRSEFASDDPGGLESQRRRHRAAEEAQGDRPTPYRLDDSVFEPLSGREFGYRYTEGWPPEVAADLEARGIAF